MYGCGIALAAGVRVEGSGEARDNNARFAESAKLAPGCFGGNFRALGTADAKDWMLLA